jgi:hypothetical protein
MVAGEVDGLSRFQDQTQAAVVSQLVHIAALAGVHIARAVLAQADLPYLLEGAELVVEVY